MPRGGLCRSRTALAAAVFEAQWRRHRACDTWEWLVPPKKSQLPSLEVIPSVRVASEVQYKLPRSLMP